ncbi:hypothetical protein GALL_299450 [mine drainage metagenome]|uniref:Uncharacterized protein n=1 Tax=mine drainage metagenome TaxID=410659 RepID=A0A1J5RJ59_9ZZZZ
MKHFLISAAIAAMTMIAPAYAADVGVSVNVGEPGFYGRLDIGDFPHPQVLYRQPIAVRAVSMERQPIYLHVPPGQARHWRRHCGEYNACNERVYFVQDNWYNREYAPRYQELHRGRRNAGHDLRRDEDQGNRGGDRQENGHSHGNGHVQDH